MTDQQPAPAGQAPAPLPPELVSAILRDGGSPYSPAQITVFCDRDGCGAEETADYMVREDMTDEQRLGVARSHLVESKGWRCTPEDGDFCPEHTSPGACGRCKRPFDTTDKRFDGHAQHAATPWCKACVDRCHESTDAFHRCPICA
ncbi:hypothetical protein AB0H77_15550 [Streptomyces sp. NPDC050844]|uniref:hypothetical protein n=1 Tax=Streptomyces sp. NPDC050844 TaxID=3155790 RepID=UPI0033D8184B